MSKPIKRIAINTGGGDAPGLNAVIQSVVIAADNLGWQCYGIRDGFNGIMFPERYPEGGVYRLKACPTGYSRQIDQLDLQQVKILKRKLFLEFV